MVRYTILFFLAVAVVALLLLVAGQMGLLRGKAPVDIGVKEGKLKRPSLTQNSVTSQADLWHDHPQQAYASIAAFSVAGDGSAEMAKLAAILQTMPRTTIVQKDAGYIYAQCTTQLLKYTDDVEFYLDTAAKVIDVRSASRMGQKDFGVNRARIEQIRAAMTA
jgi:uncharacterized protein (DUF1499 family)